MLVISERGGGGGTYDYILCLSWLGFQTFHAIRLSQF